MIVKKILNPEKSSSKNVRITRLAEYILTPETEGSAEKCAYAGALGFFAKTPAGQISEMVALAEDAVRSPDPMVHYVISWRHGEQPSHDQVEKAVGIFLKHMQITDHQAIYGLHADTGNYHLHLLVNRAHPVPGIQPKTKALQTRVVKINGGFDIEAAHQACALIEHAQSWQSEANALWRVTDDGGLAPTNPDPEKPERPVRKQRRDPPQRRADVQYRKETPSVTQRMIDIVAPILDSELPSGQAGRCAFNAALKAHNMTHVRKGSGYVFMLDDVAVKASDVDRRATLKGLTKRFGVDQTPDKAHDQADGKAHDDTNANGTPPAPPAHPLDARPLFADKERLARIKNWDHMHTALAAYRLRIDRKGSGALICSDTHTLKASDVHRNASLSRLERQFGPYEPRAHDPDRQPQTDAAPPNPDRRAYEVAREQYRVAKAAARIAYQQTYDRDLAALKEKQAKRRRALTLRRWTDRGSQLNAMRHALRLLHDAQMAALREDRLKAEREHRRRYPPWPGYRTWSQDSWIVPGDPSGPPEPVADIRNYTARVVPAGVAYCHHKRQARPDFVDTGSVIRFWRPYDVGAFRAAAQVVAAKGARSIRIRSRSPEFIGLAIRTALEQGLAISNPELQDQVAAEQRRQAAPAAVLHEHQQPDLAPAASPPTTNADIKPPDPEPPTALPPLPDPRPDSAPIRIQAEQPAPAADRKAARPPGRQAPAPDTSRAAAAPGDPASAHNRPSRRHAAGSGATDRAAAAPRSSSGFGPDPHPGRTARPRCGPQSRPTARASGSSPDTSRAAAAPGDPASAHNRPSGHHAAGSGATDRAAAAPRPPSGFGPDPRPGRPRCRLASGQDDARPRRRPGNPPLRLRRPPAGTGRSARGLSDRAIPQPIIRHLHPQRQRRRRGLRPRRRSPADVRLQRRGGAPSRAGPGRFALCRRLCVQQISGSHDHPGGARRVGGSDCTLGIPGRTAPEGPDAAAREIVASSASAATAQAARARSRRAPHRAQHASCYLQR